jgi:flagellar biosynthesis/type III secretory pathway ATPase
MREALSAYRGVEDLIRLGAYVSGSNSVLETGIRLRPELLEFWRLDQSGTASFHETVTRI